MGNQASTTSTSSSTTSPSPSPLSPLESAAAHAARPIQRLLRPSNALGLSKTELDKRCQPSGLYPSCQWDDRAIRRLIGDGKLAMRQKGSEHRLPKDVECPICFLNYSQINITKCCQANICTECFLQVRPQKDYNKPAHSNSNSSNSSSFYNYHHHNSHAGTCPFCNASRLQVTVAQELDEASILERQQEEQRTIEAEIRARSASISSSTCSSPNTPSNDIQSSTTTPPHPAGAGAATTTDSTTTNTITINNTPPPTTAASPEQAFGSSLKQHAQLLRARSSSLASEASDRSNNPNMSNVLRLGAGPVENGDGNYHQPHPDHDFIYGLAMTPSQRELLEAEMRAQHSHPLALQLQQEEAQRRMQNEYSYYQRQTARLRELRARRDLLTQQQQQQQAAADQSRMNNATRTGAAILEMGVGGQSSSRSNQAAVNPQSLDDLVVLEAAIMLSMEEENRRRAREQAQQEQGQQQQGNTNFNAAAEAPRSSSSSSGGGGGGGTAEDLTAHMQSLMRTLQSSRRGRRDRNGNATSSSSSNSNSSSTLRSRMGGLHMLANEASMETAAMLMRGISEEEQIALAIAASLAETSQGPSSTAAASGDDDTAGQSPPETAAAAAAETAPPRAASLKDDGNECIISMDDSVAAAATAAATADDDQDSKVSPRTKSCNN